MKRLHSVLRVFAALVVLLTTAPASSQTLLADDAGVPPDLRIPLVLIHGLCADRSTWTHDDGLAPFARASAEVGARFKLYYFEPAPTDECREEAFTPAQVRALAETLAVALEREPGIGADREIAIVAHGSGGLVARSFLQELGQAARTRVAVTLATPHHDLADVTGVDPAGESSALACDASACDDAATMRRAAWRKIVAIGLVTPATLGGDRVDDGVVPIDSAIFAGAGRDVRRRYLGLGGQEAGSGCWGDPSAHLAITHGACLVEDDRGDTFGVFEAVARELLPDHRADREKASEKLLELEFLPDLVITSVGTVGGPVVLAPGQTFTASVTTKNQGLGAAGASTTRLYLSTDAAKSTNDKLLIPFAAIPALAVNASSTKLVTVTVPASTVPLSYYLLACADTATAVDEFVETNNCSATASPLVIVARPDLVMLSAGTPPSAASPGGMFTTTYLVQNGGLWPSPASTTRFYLSLDSTKSTNDKLLTGTHALPALDPGQEYTPTAPVQVTIPTNTLPGAYHVIACADATNAIVENYETNNCAASGPKVQVGKPDLRVIEMDAYPFPGNATVGLTLSVFPVTVKNAGVGPAPVSYVRFYLSEDTVKSSNDKPLVGDTQINSLDPGDQYSPFSPATPAIPLTTPVGTYHVIACADGGADVAESNETNNCLASAQTINVTKSDLVISAITTPAITAPRGMVIQVTDTTFNQGLGVSFQTTTTRYYLSLDQAKSTNDKQLSGNRPVGVLGGGESSTATIDVTIPSNTVPAVYWLLACADTGGDANELNETNNCTASAAQLTVTP